MQTGGLRAAVRSLTLQTKIILLVLTLLSLVMALVSLLFHQMVTATIQEETGRRALTLARAVAQIPEVRAAFALEDPAAVIQPIAERIRQETGAEFVVVGNAQSLRYSHPMPDRLGRPMVGGDNDRALLHGESYTSVATGTLGPSLRGKTPIFSDSGEIIGLVSVGFLLTDIEKIADAYALRIFGTTLLGLAVGVFGAVLLGRSVKREILGLEPYEIAALLHERTAILESIHEGILAVDMQGRITLVNQTAKQILAGGSDVEGQPIVAVLPNTRLMEVLRTGQSHFNREMIIGSELVVVNRIPILSGGRVVGAVASFRIKSEIDRLSRELSEVRRYAEALRAQTHEFTNKLYTISGLIQLERYGEAIEYISEVNHDHQDLIRFLMAEIPDVLVGAILLGKKSRAQELGIDFRINRESSLHRIPPHIDRHLLVTILGNLSENSLEALQSREPAAGRWVEVFITDIGREIILEVEDNGPGIEPAIMDQVFREGFTTKADHSGIGLPLVQRAVRQLGGTLTFASRPGGGLLFTVAIPKAAPAAADPAEEVDRSVADG